MKKLFFVILIMTAIFVFVSCKETSDESSEYSSGDESEVDPTENESNGTAGESEPVEYTHSDYIPYLDVSYSAFLEAVNSKGNAILYNDKKWKEYEEAETFLAWVEDKTEIPVVVARKDAYIGDYRIIQGSMYYFISVYDATFETNGVGKSFVEITVDRELTAEDQSKSIFEIVKETYPTSEYVSAEFITGENRFGEYILYPKIMFFIYENYLVSMINYTRSESDQWYISSVELFDIEMYEIKRQQ